MNDIDETKKFQQHAVDAALERRRSQRQRISTSPDDRSTTAAPTARADVVAIPGVGNSNSLPGHQSGRSKATAHHFLEHADLNLSDNLHSRRAAGDHELHSSNHSPPPPSSSSSLLRKKNLSTSDLDPSERKKQAALAKVEAKLEKAQRLHQKAHQSVEQEISDFLRVTTIPTGNLETNSVRTTNATFDKRIRTLQDTKKELERKIATYQSDLSRIQAGEIPHNYTSSKDVFTTLKSTAVKVASVSLKHRSANSTDTSGTTNAAGNLNEPSTSVQHSDLDHHHANPNLPLASAAVTMASATGAVNNNQNLPTQSQHGHAFDAAYSSQSSSLSNEIGNSQFYIDANHEHVYDGDKSNRKHEINIPETTVDRLVPLIFHPDGSALHDTDKSPIAKRRLTDDSTFESYDRTSDHSTTDDRAVSSSVSKRNTPTIHHEYQQLNTKIDSMQKIIDRYELRIGEIQTQFDSLIVSSTNERDQCLRLNDELANLTELHQNEMLLMKTDLKNLEDRLLYKFNDYWNELLEKLDKLDTRTAKVEQTQTHSLETEDNTHRIISKLVNILLTVFAIILLLLSTIKNLVQSRIHALTLLILALAWITLHYLPPNYFQTPFLKSLPSIFKRTS